MVHKCVILKLITVKIFCLINNNTTLKKERSCVLHVKISKSCKNINTHKMEKYHKYCIYISRATPQMDYLLLMNKHVNNFYILQF